MVRVLYNNEEIELTLERLSNDKNYGVDQLVAKNVAYPDTYIFLFAENGLVKDIQIFGEISIFENDQTGSYEVILSRAQEAYTQLINEEFTGVYGSIDSDAEEHERIKPYNPDNIKVRQDKFAIEYVITKQIPRGILDLNPEFQRKFVWDRRRQSRLIESIMLGIPIPVMYLSESLTGMFHVVDGLQRLSTFNDYLNNKFPLKELEHLTQYEGAYFSEKVGKGKKFLDLSMVTRIESYQLYFNIIEKTSPSEVKYDIFERLNTGGLPLNAQEIRNCNAEIHVRNFLKKASESPEFKSATDNSVKGKRMDDQELVLRFAGFYLRQFNSEFSSKVEYKGNMRLFLNEVNEYLNRLSKFHLDELAEKFLLSMQVCFYLFGKYSFRKCTPSDFTPGVRKPLINKSMFVVWSVLATQIDFECLKLIFSPGEFAEKLSYRMILVEESFSKKVIDSDYNRLFSTNTFDLKTLNTSFQQTRSFLEEYNLLKYD